MNFVHFSACDISTNLEMLYFVVGTELRLVLILENVLLDLKFAQLL